MYQPVIIIGAGRSGTNILRDVLTEAPGVGTWPCDEINYIWRHGNVRHPNDEFSPEQANLEIRRYIRKAFSRLAKKDKLEFVVEKTCANSLRVSFVNQIVPEAKYVFIVRDGRDVVSSAMKRWNASLEIPYVARKARFVPVTDVPYYGARFLWNRFYRVFSSEKRLAFWGPRFEGMEDMLLNKSLPEVCAAQWVRCVKKAEQELNEIEESRVLKLYYEDFVRTPGDEIKRILDFLNINDSRIQVNQLGKNVSPKSIGKWKDDLDDETLNLIAPIIDKTMKRHGYISFEGA